MMQRFWLGFGGGKFESVKFGDSMAALVGWLRRSMVLVVAIAIVWVGLTGCGAKVGDGGRDRDAKALKPERRFMNRVEEAGPPAVIQQLNLQLERYQPQVKIMEPRQGQTLDSESVSVKLSVQGLPLFKNKELGLGPHVNLLVDDRFYGEIFDVSEAIFLEDLAPGTHTLRAFVDRPWHESFKNEGAYAQTTFHIFEPSRQNNPDSKKPLLTYSQPVGTVGVEPVLLDFYLTNAPLHLVARKDEGIEDWRVQVTVNGESFVMDSWQSVYLQGFKKGKNWVELELLGDGGEPLDNVYNDTVNVVTLDPKAVTGLTKLFNGQLPYDEALAIIDPDYVRPQPEPAVVPEPEPEQELEIEVPAAETSEVEAEAEPAIAPEENESENIESEITELEPIEPEAEPEDSAETQVEILEEPVASEVEEQSLDEAEPDDVEMESEADAEMEPEPAVSDEDEFFEEELVEEMPTESPELEQGSEPEQENLTQPSASYSELT